jgi:hypothetical protein
MASTCHLQGRMEDEHQCILVRIGATAEGHKEPVGFQAGFRESARNWRELLADLSGRGLTVAPKLAVGDGLPEGPERGVSRRRPRNRKPRFGIWTVLEGPGTRQAPEPMVSVGSDNANSP